jgi:LEA14-like dessication related protein
MRKKLVKFLFIIITILYVIIGALLFINIQVLESPEIILEIEVTEINSEEAVIHSKINIENTNSFDMSVKNLEMIITTKDGYEASHVKIEGGIIPANEKKTFTKDVKIAFAGHSPDVITSKITGDVGMNILFIEKTIPLNMGVVTSLEKVINDFAAPIISATIEFVDMTAEKITLSSIINSYNPNSFEIFMKNITGEIITDTGKIVGDLNLPDANLLPKDSIDINTTGEILLEALNAEKIMLNIDGVAGAKIAGFEKDLAFGTQINLIVPDLEELIFSKDKPVQLSIKANNKLTLKGLVTDINLEMINTYNVELTLRDTICRLYTVKNDELNLLGENTIEGELSVIPGETGNSLCEIIVPFSKIFTVNPTSEYLMVSVTARLTIKGLDAAVYVELRGYTDFHIFN